MQYEIMLIGCKTEDGPMLVPSEPSYSNSVYWNVKTVCRLLLSMVESKRDPIYNLNTT